MSEHADEAAQPRQEYTANSSSSQQYSHYPTGPAQQPQTFDAYGNPIPADAKSMAVFSHLSSLLLYVITASTLSFLGPLIFWLIYRNKPGYQFVTANSARAFNFNFTIWLINLLAWIFTIITLGLGVFITIIIIGCTTILLFIFHIIASIKSGQGEVYNYPLQIKLLSN